MTDQTLDGAVHIGVRVGTIRLGGAPDYTGPYEVTPRAHEAQTLGTKGTLMADDVTVREIPEYLTSNEAGGYTCNIG